MLNENKTFEDAILNRFVPPTDDELYIKYNFFYFLKFKSSRKIKNYKLNVF